MKRKKLKLIWPMVQQYRMAGNEVRWRFPPLAMGMVAALTPPDIDIEICDENVEMVNYSDTPDLVGINCVTASANRAYSIADQYRERGVPVVMGGIHPTVLPQEALMHADSVIVGEAENIWGAFIEDFRSGKNRRIYKGEALHDLKNLPIPRRDLLEKNRKRYDAFNGIQTMRGCPYNCEFCSTGLVSGRKVRCRPIGDVIDEIKTMRFEKLRPLIFWDDTIHCVPDYARELFQALKPLNIIWGGYATANMVENEELIRLARESGCLALFVGFESVSQSSKAQMKKSAKLKHDYNEVVNIFHKHGISLLGSFVFGLDGDTPSVFKETLQFIKKSKLDSIYFNIVQPYPGTQLFERLKNEGRIRYEDWNRYILDNACFIPKKMTVDQLEEGYRWIYREASSIPQILTRLSRVMIQRKHSLLSMYTQNIGLRRTCNLVNATGKG
jgi:radical SAM superfamily enzyme YgiQ (UPF0313 family)